MVLFLPSRLDVLSASCAFSKRPSRSLASSGNVAMPMLTVAGQVAFTASLALSAAVWAFSEDVSGSRTTNSSQPSLAIASTLLITFLNVEATPFRSLSPAPSPFFLI